MKNKFIAFLLAVVICFATVIPAFAAESSFTCTSNGEDVVATVTGIDKTSGADYIEVSITSDKKRPLTSVDVKDSQLTYYIGKNDYKGLTKLDTNNVKLVFKAISNYKEIPEIVVTVKGLDTTNLSVSAVAYSGSSVVASNTMRTSFEYVTQATPVVPTTRHKPTVQHREEPTQRENEKTTLAGAVKVTEQKESTTVKQDKKEEPASTTDKNETTIKIPAETTKVKDIVKTTEKVNKDKADEDIDSSYTHNGNKIFIIAVLILVVIICLTYFGINHKSRRKKMSWTMEEDTDELEEFDPDAESPQYELVECDEEGEYTGD